MAMELSFTYTMPDLLLGKVEVSEAYQNYNARGNPTSFGVDLDFPEMLLTKTLKSSEFQLLRGKIEDSLKTWEGKYQRHLDRQHKENRTKSVEEMNSEAKEAIDLLTNILGHTLDVNDAVDWNAIKRKDDFRINPEKLISNGKRPDFIQFNKYGKPTEFIKMALPTKPSLETIRNKYGFFSKLFSWKRY